MVVVMVDVIEDVSFHFLDIDGKPYEEREGGGGGGV
jgi:hypothetical protein